jgi:hypothetical protein
MFVFAAATCIISGCQGVPGPTDAPSLMPAANDLGTARVPVVKRVTAVEFHGTNRMDWVGRLHNRVMDELRAEVRRSRPKDACRTLERLVVDGALSARADGQPAIADERRIRKLAFAAVGCGRRDGDAGRASMRDRRPQPPIAFAGNSPGETEDLVLSGDAWALIDQVQAAGGSASSAGDLASELAAISAQAQALTADEAAVVDAMASVSLSSYEYWSENGEAMANAMADAYGACIERGGGDSCYYASAWGSRERGQSTQVRLAANGAGPVACTVDVGTIWQGDKWGAGVGLAIGLRSGTVHGAIIGIFGGAAAGSGGASLYEFGRYLHCAFK